MRYYIAFLFPLVFLSMPLEALCAGHGLGSWVQVELARKRNRAATSLSFAVILT